MTNEMYKEIWMLIAGKIRETRNHIDVRLPMLHADNIADLSNDGVIKMARDIGNYHAEMEYYENLLEDFEKEFKEYED